MTFLPLLRELVRTYQAFERFSVPHIRSMDLTAPQFDVIATLANQPPMTCKELGEKTLITKGTLTGILDRLTAKGLMKREVNAEDGRSQKVTLTEAGVAVFESAFPAHIAHLGKGFKQLSAQESDALILLLKKLRGALESTE